MKKIALIFACCTLAYSAYAQAPIDSVTHRISFEAVKKSSLNKDDLFRKGLDWMAKTFNSSNDVIQIKDKDAGQITGKYYIQPYESKFGFVSATITLLFKAGRYKYIITDLNYQGAAVFAPWRLEDDPKPGKVGMTKGAQHKIKENTFAQIQLLINDLNTYMGSETNQNSF